MKTQDKIETQKAIQKPRSISTAVNLLLACLVIGLIKLPIVYLFSLTAAAPVVVLPLVFFFTLCLIYALLSALSLFLVCKIYAGRNWARITFLVMFVLDIWPTLRQILVEFSRTPIFGVISLVQVGLEVCAMFFIFTGPGAAWFRKVNIDLAKRSEDELEHVVKDKQT